jgi:hypothetical protein
MTTGQGKPKRARFSTVNKYQIKIILLTFFPSALIFLTFIGIVCVGDPIISRAMAHTSFAGMERLISRFSGWMLIVMCCVFAASSMAAFNISLNMVGAFERINRELDDIIAGQSQRAITCRPGDELARDLLIRVNVLAEYYMEHKHGKKKS